MEDGQRYGKASAEANENVSFQFDCAEPHPVLSKDSERRAQRQMKT